jgi:hypothetical protein
MLSAIDMTDGFELVWGERNQKAVSRHIIEEELIEKLRERLGWNKLNL